MWTNIETSPGQHIVLAVVGGGGIDLLKMRVTNNSVIKRESMDSFNRTVYIYL